MTDNLLNPKHYDELSPEIATFLKKTVTHCLHIQPEYMQKLSLNPLFVKTVFNAWAGSDFILKNFLQHPDVVSGLFDSCDILITYPQYTYAERVNKIWQTSKTEVEFNIVLRQFRQREMVRIAWRDLAKISSLQETLADVSSLADACICGAYNFYYGYFCNLLGYPRNATGEDQHMLILALGKLGGKELNFSSDIDLIFTYTGAGETQGARKNMDNDKFFIRVAQSMIKSLDEVTADGFVFRVDMRLRPYGSAGPLVINLSTMETYYQEQGREWERYALLKARIVNPENFPEAAARLSDMLTRFVYRRYVDYGIISAMRELKKLLDGDARQKGLEQDIKRGRGGIRELEFIVQSTQLIRGGKEPFLQSPSLLSALDRLRESHCLEQSVLDGIECAYIFLRNTEHVLQMFSDRQTQQLPTDELARARVAFALNFPDWKSLSSKLNEHMSTVHKHFEFMISQPSSKTKISTEKEQLLTDLRSVWLGVFHDEENIIKLQLAGFGDFSSDILSVLKKLQNIICAPNLQSIAKNRLDTLLPLLLIEIAKVVNPVITLERCCLLINSVIRRSAYLALLLENPDALKLWVRLFSSSYYVAHEMTQFPILLDELLSLELAYSQNCFHQTDLQKRLLLITDNDIEERLDCIRRFKQANTLKIVVNDLIEQKPVLEVCRNLSELATIVLSEILAIATEQMVEKHGMPVGNTDQEFEFGIVAYGKLGSYEMGYNSDIDLIFLYDADEQALTAKNKKLTSAEFAIRLAQRIIHILSMQTQRGALYDLDLRLRPSGSAGSLVSSVSTFFDYQMEKAWVWEHQALVRARAVVGSAILGNKFDQIRATVLKKRHDEDELCEQVISMRSKVMTKNESTVGFFDIKMGVGGITDIEFMVQYAVLQWACLYPELTKYTQTLQLIKALGQRNIFSTEEVSLLCDSLLHYYVLLQRCALQGTQVCVPDAEVGEYPAIVQNSWSRLMKS